MKANLSKKDMKTVNNVWKAMVCGSAIALAVVAVIYNPGHLFTAGLLFLVGIESEIVKKEDNEIC